MMTEIIRDAMRVISGEDDREFATEDGIITPERTIATQGETFHVPVAGVDVFVACYGYGHTVAVA
jgi:hypothetical protein